MVEKFKVNVLFTAPTALRAIRREDPDSALLKKYNISSLRALFLAGERSEPGIITAYQGLLSQHAAPGAIVNDNYWSTESGSPITAIQLNSTFPPLMPKPGSAGLPLPGMDVRIVDDEGKELPLGTMGNIVLGLPLPPTALGTVWGNEKRFQEWVLPKRLTYLDANILDTQSLLRSFPRERRLLRLGRCGCDVGFPLSASQKPTDRSTQRRTGLRVGLVSLGRCDQVGQQRFAYFTY